MDTKDNFHAHAACCEGEHAHHHHHEHDHGHNHDHAHAEGEEPTAWWRPALSAALLVIGLVADHWAAFYGLGQSAGPLVRLLWYVGAFLPVGFGVMREAWEEARAHGDWFSEFMLMSVAAVGAFAIGEYPEAVAVMLLYCVGEALQDRAADRARHNVTALLAFRPDRARRVRPSADGRDGDTYEETAPESIGVGEEIEVRAGERVPLDGQLLSDDTSFDTAALTGESLPRLIARGGEVMAGMIASDRTVRLRVARPASESAVSRLLRMVEEASERKAPTELFIRRFAHVYTPTVIALAALAVVIPWVVSLCAESFTFVAAEWVRRALVFLVISCPCALVVSIPLGYFGGIGAASRRGILFKGGHSLDAVAELQAVAFDKTGTLTTGEFRVTDTGGLSDEALAAVAAMEGESSHPIARAIVDFCRERHIQPSASLDKAAICHEAGYGLSGEDWLVGTLRLLDHHGVAYPETLQKEAGTLVAVAHKGRYLGRILLGDTLRTDAREAIAALRGLHTEILSGDKQALVDKVAAQLGVSRGTGDLLPAQKVERIAALQREGRKVAFVGDGINDAPVLALADVGFAMGGLGSDMAVETADVVIQTDQPSKVAEAVAIGRRTRSVVWQNIIMSIGIKVAVMALGLAGFASLWMAVFADSGVALLAVLNATRVLIPAGQARNA